MNKRFFILLFFAIAAYGQLTYPLTKLDKDGNDAPITMSILNLAYDFF